MVRGLDVFRSFFREFPDNYILIGGAACDEHLNNAGLTFRATKDLDIILIVEALNPEFVKHFWEFVKAGEYKEKQKSEGDRKYYRFLQPAKENYPQQLELFARNPDLLDLAEDTTLTPIPVDEDLSSLSAILMNDDYYGLTIKNSEVSDNLHLATIKTLICLKAKAFLDLRIRKEKGEKIDGNDIKKHKNDVIRLSVLLKEDDSLLLPESIVEDIRKFLKILESEPPDFRAIGKSMGIPSLENDSIINQLTETFLK
jgi:hypothetical protein